MQGNIVAAKKSLAESLEINRRLRLTRQLAYSVDNLGSVALMEGDLAGAQRQHQEALELRTQLGEKGTAAESRSALATIALEKGLAADAESLAREAAIVFEEQHATSNEATARATLALAILMQGRRDAALREVQHARALIRNSQNVLARMTVAIAAARIEGTGNAAGAIRELESLRAEAAQRGIPRYEFEARRAIADIEGHSSPTGAAHIASLQKDAKARGFLLYAR
jgi:tetratricopeptide (TPR) repeat protein